MILVRRARSGAASALARSSCVSYTVRTVERGIPQLLHSHSFLQDEMGPEKCEEVRQKIPVKKFCTPEEVAHGMLAAIYNELQPWSKQFRTVLNRTTLL